MTNRKKRNTSRHAKQRTHEALQSIWHACVFVTNEQLYLRVCDCVNQDKLTLTQQNKKKTQQNITKYRNTSTDYTKYIQIEN